MGMYFRYTLDITCAYGFMCGSIAYRVVLLVVVRSCMPACSSIQLSYFIFSINKYSMIYFAKIELRATHGALHSLEEREQRAHSPPSEGITYVHLSRSDTHAPVSSLMVPAWFMVHVPRITVQRQSIILPCDVQLRRPTRRPGFTPGRASPSHVAVPSACCCAL